MMPWYFMIPLAIALVVTYILKHSSDEIAYLAVAILIVSLIVSLVIAPWQVQLTLLMLVLLSNIRLKQPSNNKDKDTKISGTSNSEVNSLSGEENEDEVIGKYRGQVWKTSHKKNEVVVQQETPVVGLKYRGAVVQHQDSTTSEEEEENPVVCLKYRGVSINSQSSIKSVVPETTVETTVLDG